MKRGLSLLVPLLFVLGLSSPAWAFPDNGVLDTFTGTDDTSPPNANWTNTSIFSSGGLDLEDNAVTTAVNESTGAAYRNDIITGAGCEAYAEIVNTANTHVAHLLCRVRELGVGTVDGYSVAYDDSLSQIYIFRVTDDGIVQLGATISQAITVNDQIGIQTIGDQICAWFKDGAGAWTQLACRTDATYPDGGRIAIIVYGSETVGALDNFGGGTVGSTVTPYALVPGLSTSANFSMTVNGTNVPVQSYSGNSFAWFAFSGSATVVVTVGATVSSYTLSPLRNPIASTPGGATVTFSLTQPKHLVFHKVNAIAEKLFIFADAPESNPPAASGTGIYNVVTGYSADPTGVSPSTTAIQNAINAATAGVAPRVVYVPSGIYTVDASILLKNNVHLYMAPGAVIKNLTGTYTLGTAYHINDQDNVTVSGRGVFYGNGLAVSSYSWLMATGSAPGTVDNFTIRDVVLLDSPTTGFRLGKTTNSTVTNLKILSGNPALSDGIDFDEVTGVTIDRAFIWSTDDNLAIGAGSSIFSYDVAGNTENITIKNSLFYQTSTGHIILIGPHVGPPFIRTILLENSDSISVANAFAMLAANGPVDIHSLTVHNVRVEEVRTDWVDMISTDFATGWGGCPNGFCITGPDNSGKIHNITFNNVVFDTLGSSVNTLSGRTATQDIATVNFNGVYRNGVLVTNAATGNLSIGAFVSGITYTNTAQDTTPPVMSNGLPSAILPAGTTSWTISVNTDEPGTCHWDVTNTTYALMTGTMASAGLTHSVVIGSLTNGYSTPHYVRCADVNGNFNTSSTTIPLAVDTSTPDTTPPSAPTNLTVGTIVLDPPSVELTWTANTEPDLAGYQMYLCTVIDCIPANLAGVPVTETTTVLNLAPNTDYWFALKALDESNNFSSIGNIVAASTADNPDVAPPSTMANLRLSGAPQRNSVLLTWDTGTDDVAIVFSVIGLCDGAACSDFEARSLPITATREITGLLANTEYCSQGKFSDAAGNQSAAFSNTVCWTTAATGLTQSRTQATARAPRVPTP